MPCSPGMTQCKASCLHRAWVLDHRREMTGWLVKQDEGGLGYKTEMAEWAEQNPAPRLRDAMTHRERPPENWQNQEHPVETPDKLTGEMSPEESWKASIEAETRTMARPGNRGAEEGLLSAALADTRAVPYLRQLTPQEFTSTPYTAPIARAIVDLESQGVRANATEVESRLREQGIVASEASWDSAAFMGEHHTADEVYTAAPGEAPLVDELHGLQRWEATAMPYQAAESFAQEVRNQSYSTGTQEAYQWGSERLAGIAADTGPHPSTTHLVQEQVSAKIAALPQPLPSQEELAELKAQLTSRTRVGSSIPVGAQPEMVAMGAGRTR